MLHLMTINCTDTDTGPVIMPVYVDFEPFDTLHNVLFVHYGAPVSTKKMVLFLEFWHGPFIKVVP